MYIPVHPWKTQTLLPYVSVNSNWIQPPGNPQENCFQGANPGHPGNFLSDSLLQGKQLWSNSRGVGQNVPKLKETAPEVCKDPLKIKKTTRQYKFLYGELNKTFIF